MATMPPAAPATAWITEDMKSQCHWNGSLEVTWAVTTLFTIDTIVKHANNQRSQYIYVTLHSGSRQYYDTLCSDTSTSHNDV